MPASLDPTFAAQPLHGMVKGFAFWQQLTLEEPPLGAKPQEQVVTASAEMFLRSYAKPC